ncbi:OpgC domain-containing protein [Pseudomonas farris]
MTFERDHRIDFFRGLALIFIFWDHVPQNLLAQFTVRNFPRDLVQEMGLQYFLSNPQQALMDELLLRFKPNLMDPLPLYILLLLGLPLVLPMLLRKAKYVVGLSVILYLLAPWLQWNLAGTDGGVWFFNPMAWQLLFILGGAVAIHGQRPLVSQPRALTRQPVFIAALTYLMVTGLIALSWKWPSVHDAFMPQWLGESLYPISKTNLSPTRLLHFLALAYVTARLLPDTGWTRHWLAQQSCRMGRYSLEIFCFGVLLAPLADMLNAMGGNTLAMQMFSALLGVGLMALLGAWLDFNKRLNRSAQVAVV